MVLGSLRGTAERAGSFDLDRDGTPDTLYVAKTKSGCPVRERPYHVFLERPRCKIYLGDVYAAAPPAPAPNQRREAGLWPAAEIDWLSAPRDGGVTTLFAVNPITLRYEIVTLTPKSNGQPSSPGPCTTRDFFQGIESFADLNADGRPELLFGAGRSESIYVDRGGCLDEIASHEASLSDPSDDQVLGASFSLLPNLWAPDTIGGFADFVDEYGHYFGWMGTRYASAQLAGDLSPPDVPSWVNPDSASAAAPACEAPPSRREALPIRDVDCDGKRDFIRREGSITNRPVRTLWDVWHSNAGCGEWLRGHATMAGLGEYPRPLFDGVRVVVSDAPLPLRQVAVTTWGDCFCPLRSGACPANCDLRGPE